MIFQNRQQAGELLAEPLLKFKNENPVVLALPRGGVPVAAEIADELNALLDVLIVRKIGAPYQPELAVGAVCEDDEPIWSKDLLGRLGIEPDELYKTVREEKNRIRDQKNIFRFNRNLPNLKNKVVIIVDDGLATGATMAAAIKFLKGKGVSKTVMAVPVAAAQSVVQLRKRVDEIIILEEREDLNSVGQWYEDFSQVSNEEVVALLERNRKKHINLKSPSHLKIPVGDVQLDADLALLPSMKALIIFAHGSGSSRNSPRNQMVAKYLNSQGFGTVLFDLLTTEEGLDRKNIFDIDFLSRRLIEVTRWLRLRPEVENVPIGFFGASTGAGAALMAASKMSDQEKLYAVVSRGGRPDLAGEALRFVQAPTLLLVGSEDKEVITLNKKAQQFLAVSKLSIISGATHVFEEAGTLEEVARQATNWFLVQLPQSHQYKSPGSASLQDAIEQDMRKLKTEQDFEQLIQSIKDNRVVMLGEATHGTEDFYRIRRLISQRLIKEHGFNFIAVEGDWPDAYRLNKYINKGEGENAKSVLMHNHRWPTWMWANDEVVKLAEWMKLNKAGFYGLDVYSLFESIDEVVGYLKKNQPNLKLEIEKAYSCFEPFEDDEISYARSLLTNPSGCQKDVLYNLQKLLELRIENAVLDGDELFSSQQNAWIVANAESYYRAMLGGDASSWNVRDSHMMDTLDRLLERHGENAKAIVWAHNTHIGDYRATDMKAGGYINLGGLARQSYGEENVALVGFGSYQGEVLAGAKWGGPEQVMPLPPAHEDSYEHHFHQVAQAHNVNQFYLLLENKTHSILGQRLGHRAVGVVYDPRRESRGNYVPTELSKRYDAFIFVDSTQALKSLHTAYVTGEFPETWPSGQ